MQQWNDLIKNQFVWGAKKYCLAENSSRESTDILVDKFGYRWLIGTLAKYYFRFKNLAQEKELLKIGCYCYIIWLKRGFHLSSRGSDNIVDTNVEIKDKYFENFLMFFQSWWSEQENKQYFNNIDYLYDQLKIWNDGEWQDITEDEIFAVFAITYSIWNEKFSQVSEHKEDIGKIK